MPTAYEKTYGAVAFYDVDGTAIFDTESDLGLWTTMDEEPSPGPKWIRVDVPGADGAVDLSRALAGQTTYEMREIRLGFGGKCADHATALALVHQMRRALHGARVRVETLLTAQIGGYYIADCECDGIAYASGDVEVTVTATADPFIRVGNQTLALPFVGPDVRRLRPIDGRVPSHARRCHRQLRLPHRRGRGAAVVGQGREPVRRERMAVLGQPAARPVRQCVGMA